MSQISVLLSVIQLWQCFFLKWTNIYLHAAYSARLGPNETESADTEKGPSNISARSLTGQITFLCYCILTQSPDIFTGHCCQSRFFLVCRYTPDCVKARLLFGQHYHTVVVCIKREGFITIQTNKICLFGCIRSVGQR